MNNEAVEIIKLLMDGCRNETLNAESDVWQRAKHFLAMYEMGADEEIEIGEAGA